MKIAFLNIYSGVVNRGLETFILEIGQRLAKENLVTVFQAGEPNNQLFNIKKINIKFDWTQKDSSGKLSRKIFIDYWSRQILFFTLKVLPYLWREKYDVVIPTNGGWQTVICRLITWFRGGKIMISGQSGPGYDDRWNLLWRPNLFIALTEESKKSAQKNGFGVKVEAIPNGVDLNYFNLRAKTARIPLKKPIILCVGALTPFKRIDLTIKAVAHIKNASLLVVGDGDLKNQLEELGNKLLKDKFYLTKSSYKDMPSYYKVADLFTLASSPVEAFGIVYVEAMACGLPVVATDTPARREIIGDAGLYVNPEDIEAYTMAIDKTLQTDWVDRPRKQAEKFSWDNIAKKYADILLRIA